MTNARQKFVILLSCNRARTLATTAAKAKPTNFPSPTTSRSFHTNQQDKIDILSSNRTLYNLINSGCSSSALDLFDEMPTRDVVTWNIMITGLFHCGFPRKSLCLYNQMVSLGVIESCSTFSTVLSMCSNAGFYRAGLQVHSRVIVFGLTMNIYITSALVDLYMHIGLCNVALKLVNGLPEKNLAVWNVLLRGFCEMGLSGELLKLCRQMILEGQVPNGLTFCYLIRGCGNERLLDEGLQLHCKVIKIGWSTSNLFVANALVDFYSACGDMIDTWKSFIVIPPGNVISWNSIVSVYSTRGFGHNALEMFNRMHFWGKKASARSFLGFLNLSRSSKNLCLGKQTHCFVLKLGFDTGNVLVQSALVDMYGKCGDIESSVCVFDNVPDRSLECCNSLMSSLLNCGMIEDVIELFGLMIDENIGFDEVSLSSTLKALSMSASANFAACTLLHSCAIKSGFEYDTAVACSFIDAYSRSGQVKFCCQVFEKLPSPNVVCFTSIINAFARNGMGRESLKMLDAMIRDGLKPDKITFLCVLMGCNHSGLMQEGRLVFNSMEALYGVSPERKHYSCMVDLLGRAGLVDEAEDLLSHSPIEDDYIMWSSLLRSCTVHRNEQVGRKAAEKLMKLEPKEPAAWSQASKFYSEIGDFETALRIREVAMARKLSAEIGCSLIEV